MSAQHTATGSTNAPHTAGAIPALALTGIAAHSAIQSPRRCQHLSYPIDHEFQSKEAYFALMARTRHDALEPRLQSMRMQQQWNVKGAVPCKT